MAEIARISIQTSTENCNVKLSLRKIAWAIFHDLYAQSINKWHYKTISTLYNVKIRITLM